MENGLLTSNAMNLTSLTTNENRKASYPYTTLEKNSQYVILTMTTFVRQKIQVNQSVDNTADK